MKQNILTIFSFLTFLFSSFNRFGVGLSLFFQFCFCFCFVLFNFFFPFKHFVSPKNLFTRHYYLCLLNYYYFSKYLRSRKRRLVSHSTPFPLYQNFQQQAFIFSLQIVFLFRFYTLISLLNAMDTNECCERIFLFLFVAKYTTINDVPCHIYL